MAFSDYQTIDQALEEFRLRSWKAPLLPAGARLEAPQWLAENLRFAQRGIGPRRGETSVSESLIFPILLEAWKRHPRVRVWSHETLTFDDRLTGVPDYFVTAWNGSWGGRFETPLLTVVEAKREDFDGGWGQCLAAMVACRKINGAGSPPIWGFVTTGLLWEFGRLDAAGDGGVDGGSLTIHDESVGIADLPRVFGLVDHVFTECQSVVPALAA